MSKLCLQVSYISHKTCQFLAGSDISCKILAGPFILCMVVVCIMHAGASGGEWTGRAAQHPDGGHPPADSALAAGDSLCDVILARDRPAHVLARATGVNSDGQHLRHTTGHAPLPEMCEYTKMSG